MKEFYGVLEQCPLFDGIRMEELTGLLGCLGGRKLTASKDQTVFQEGEPATYIGIVLRGGVQMVRQDYYGNRSIVAYIGVGGLFGESYACAGMEALPVSIVAAEDSVILLIDARRITVCCSNACAFHTRIIYNMLRLVASMNLIFDQKIQITSKRTTREKLMTYLMNQVKLQNSTSFTIPYDRQELADYLEVDRSGLSVQISKLRSEGVLECHKNRFTVLKAV
ncbi:MAG: Crp/Fnr family transcriptional regulator [Oscillospiraceae bacterium]|nr:Crp/Fnr family transcriptional regulator [Oscillospiraceae bacterium]